MTLSCHLVEQTGKMIMSQSGVLLNEILVKFWFVFENLALKLYVFLWLKSLFQFLCHFKNCQCLNQLIHVSRQP